MDCYDAATNLARFLQERTGTIYGRWAGRLPAATQRALMGRFLGKGRLVIDGAKERVVHSRKVCFGTDFDTTHDLAWQDLDKDLDFSSC